MISSGFFFLKGAARDTELRNPFQHGTTLPQADDCLAVLRMSRRLRKQGKHMKNAESVAVVQEMIRGPWLVDNEILKAGPEKEAKLNRVLGCGRSRQKPERAREQRVSSNPEPLGVFLFSTVNQTSPWRDCEQGSREVRKEKGAKQSRSTVHGMR